MDAPEAVVDEALVLLAAGFDAVKLRLGYATLERDVVTTRAVRRAIPDGTVLMVDFNQALSVHEATRRGHALDGEGLEWIEEPIRMTITPARNAGARTQDADPDRRELQRAARDGGGARGAAPAIW